MKQRLLTIVGWSMLLFACVCWILLLVMPFLSYSFGQKVASMTGVVVVAEVFFG